MIFNKNHWIKLTIAVFMASAGCLASVGDGNDLSLEVEGLQAVRVVVAEGAGVEGENDRNIRDERWWIRLGERTGVPLAILIEALVDTTPVILAYLSDQSPEWALASSVQNMIYAGLYATSIAVNSYRRPHQTPSFEGNLLTIIRLGNVVNSNRWLYFLEILRNPQQYLQINEYGFKRSVWPSHLCLKNSCQ